MNLYLPTLPTPSRHGKGAKNIIPPLHCVQKTQYFVNMTNIAEIQETFEVLDDWEDRYAYLIDLGRNLPEFPENYKNECNLVKGCTSQVWMVLKNENGKIHIQADSDAHIVRGLIAIVIATYNGQDVAEVKNIDMEQIFKDLGLSDHLSPNRRNGFFAMVERVKLIS